MLFLFDLCIWFLTFQEIQNVLNIPSQLDTSTDMLCYYRKFSSIKITFEYFTQVKKMFESFFWFRDQKLDCSITREFAFLLTYWDCLVFGHWFLNRYLFEIIDQRSNGKLETHLWEIGKPIFFQSWNLDCSEDPKVLCTVIDLDIQTQISKKLQVWLPPLGSQSSASRFLRENVFETSVCFTFVGNYSFWSFYKGLSRTFRASIRVQR